MIQHCITAVTTSGALWNCYQLRLILLLCTNYSFFLNSHSFRYFNVPCTFLTWFLYFMHELDCGLTGLLFCVNAYVTKCRSQTGRANEGGKLALRWIGRSSKSSLLCTGDGKPKNLKVFTLKSTICEAQTVISTARSARHTLDIQTKKHHLPVMDRTPLEPPPVVIAVVGPPRIGQSSLISSLVKTYSRQTLTDVKGPVTQWCQVGTHGECMQAAL